MNDTETIADIIAEMRLGSTGGMPFAYRIGRPDRNVEYKTEDGKKYEHRITVIEKVTIDELADRIEAAWKRELQMIIDEANDDTALVKNCATCKHYCRNKKYCPAQDTVNVNPDILPIFRTGPCDKWKCKYTKK